MYIVGGSSNGLQPLNVGTINIGRTAGQGAQAYAPNGRYTSPPIQLGPINRILDTLRWSSWMPTPTLTMTMRYRYQNLGQDWSPWQGPFPSNGGTDIQTTTVVLTDTAQFFQYQVDLGNTLGITRAALGSTPFLLQVDIDYIIPSPPDILKRADPPDQLVAGELGQVAPGDLISYTIEMTSTSSRNLPGSLVTDVLPLGTSFVANTDYVSATFPITPNISSGVILWDAGTFPKGAQTRVVLGYAARVSNDVRAGQWLTNTLIFRSDVNEPIIRQTRHMVNAPLGLVKYQTSSAPPGSTDTVETGDTITYTVVLTNPNSAPLTGAIITDTAPAGTSFVAGSMSITPLLSGTVDASQQPLLRWNVPELGAGDAVTVQFSAQVTTVQRDAVISNQAQATTDQSLLHSSNMVIYRVVVPAELGKRANPPSGFFVARRSLITYTLTMTNPNLALLTNVVISDSVPANTTFVSCSDSCAQAGGVVVWMRNLAIGQSASVQFTVQVNSTAPNGATILNSAVLSSDQQHALSASNQTAHSVSIVGGVGEIVKSAEPPGGLALDQAIAPGALITYTLVYSNPNAAVALTNTLVSDPLPANVSYVSCTGGCLFSGGTASWSFPLLPPKATGQVKLTVRVSPSAPDGALLQNQAIISSDQGAAASEIVTHRVLVPYDLQLTKSCNVTTTLPGSTFTYTLIYTNQGPLVLNGVVITDLLGSTPPGQASLPAMTYLSIPRRTPGWQLVQNSPNGSTFRYNVGSVLPGQTGVLTMVVQLGPDIPYEVNLVNNHAVIADDGAYQGETNPANQVADVNTRIQGPDLTVSNVRITGSPSVGKPLTVTATIANRGLTNTLTWERLITPTDNTNNWFAVELYLRPKTWPSGPPAGPHDHAGGYCSGQVSPCAGAEQRFGYLSLHNLPGGLRPGDSLEARWIVTPTAIGTYSMYIQVDAGFWWLPDPAYGRTLEYDELNNTIFAGLISTGSRVYLPIVLRK